MIRGGDRAATNRTPTRATSTTGARPASTTRTRPASTTRTRPASTTDRSTPSTRPASATDRAATCPASTDRAATRPASTTDRAATPTHTPTPASTCPATPTSSRCGRCDSPRVHIHGPEGERVVVKCSLACTRVCSFVEHATCRALRGSRNKFHLCVSTCHEFFYLWHR